MTAFTGFPDEALLFFEGLEADNSKSYWNDHREQYETAVRAPMLALAAHLEPEFGSMKLFRPYRDIRFSGDKTPYKTQLGGVVAGRYVHIGVDGLFIAAGYWRTETDQVERLRAAVDDDRSGRALERAVAALRTAGYEVHGSRLKTRPRGYDADHPRLDLLRHRTMTVGRTWPGPPWLHTPECADRVAAGWREMGLLADWLDKHVGPSRLPADQRRR